mmetsp:Transcript_4832/g.10427  ORF Transcript_4832/g.10427 Transcript_4832/m.10427 type:complete len:271 (-) Transcript_4832:103-915(-)
MAKLKDGVQQQHMEELESVSASNGKKSNVWTAMTMGGGSGGRGSSASKGGIGAGAGPIVAGGSGRVWAGATKKFRRRRKSRTHCPSCKTKWADKYALPCTCHLCEECRLGALCSGYCVVCAVALHSKRGDDFLKEAKIREKKVTLLVDKGVAAWGQLPPSLKREIAVAKDMYYWAMDRGNREATQIVEQGAFDPETDMPTDRTFVHQRHGKHGKKHPSSPKKMASLNYFSTQPTSAGRDSPGLLPSTTEGGDKDSKDSRFSIGRVMSGAS